MLPCRAEQGLWSIQDQVDTPIPERWWDIQDEHADLEHGRLDGNCFYTLATNSNRLYVTDVVKKEIKKYFLPDARVSHVTYDGQNFWYIMNGSLDIVCWDRLQNLTDRYLISRDINYVYEAVQYLGICFAGKDLFVVSSDGRFLYTLERERRELKQIYQVTAYDQVGRTVYDPKPYFKCVENVLVCMYQSAGILLLIELNTLEVHQLDNEFCMDESIKMGRCDYICKILLDRSALLFEEDRNGSPELFIQNIIGIDGKGCE